MALTKTQSTTMWVLTVLLAALFVFAGAGKVFGFPEMVEGWERLPYPTWLRYVVGFFELAGGIALLIPKAALTAGSFLIIIMLGAVLTALFSGGEFLVPLAVLLLVGGLTALRAEE
jgi:uncharacterized membrane protein YphA (DoxX/SURF4 family)